jgi:NAD(P)-dependent dehydrogenase (short-subunit alcohol dehydrogenase family)
VDLLDKVAVITGGKRIGAAIAVGLAARGCDVALSYSHSHAEATETSRRIRLAGRRAEAIHADLSRPDECTALIDRVERIFGGVDILINMASVYISKPFDQLTLADWHASADVDLRAAFLCVRAAVPSMKARGGGRVINFSDWVAKSGRPRYRGYLPYYVAKAGVIALTEALALELAADAILVNAIAPGPIVPPAAMTRDAVEAVERATPLGRWGGEEEIAKAVIALLESDFITGETIRVDGGRHLK